MVSTNDIRPGQSILVDGIIYQIIEYQHVKPGKGKAFVKTKLKNLTNGGVLDKTFRADEDVEQAYIDKQTFQYLYNDADKYFFMNADSYEQIELSKDQLNDKEILLDPTPNPKRGRQDGDNRYPIEGILREGEEPRVAAI